MSTTRRSTTRHAPRSTRARVRATRPRPWPATSASRSGGRTTRCCAAAPLDGIELGCAVLADVLLAQLPQVVAAATDRALGLDLEVDEPTFLDTYVEQVALVDAEELAELGRDDHPAQLVDAPSGADRSHNGLLDPCPHVPAT